MTLQEQVITTEQAKRLKELGVKQESLFFHVFRNRPTEFWHIEQLGTTPESWQSPQDEYSAFTVAELGVMLPLKIRIDKRDYTYRVNLNKSGCWEYKYRTKSNQEGGIHKMIPLVQFANKNEAQARASLLIHLLEQNLITADEVNARLNPSNP